MMGKGCCSARRQEEITAGWSESACSWRRGEAKRGGDGTFTDEAGRKYCQLSGGKACGLGEGGAVERKLAWGM